MVRIVIRSYAFLIFIYDLISLFVNSYIAIITSIFRIFVPNKLRKVRQEIVCVVGSSRGVGREIALQLARAGAQIICLDFNEIDNQNVVREIREFGGLAYSMICDVTHRDQVDKIIDKIEKEVGVITMLFHCCSVPSPRSLVSEPPPIKKTMDVSVTSYFYVSIFILFTYPNFQLTFHFKRFFSYHFFSH